MAAEIIVMAAFSLSLGSLFQSGQMSLWMWCTDVLLDSTTHLGAQLNPVSSFLTARCFSVLGLPEVSWFSPLFPLALPPGGFLHLYPQLKFSFLLFMF